MNRMKRIASLVLTIFCLVCFSTCVTAAEKIKYDKDSNPKFPYDYYISTLLYDEIFKAVSSHCTKGGSFELYDTKILNLEQLRKNNSTVYFKMLIRVRTFSGPHNPPYGLDYLTFESDIYGTKLVNYKHTIEKSVAR